MQQYVMKKNDHIWDNEQETLIFKRRKIYDSNYRLLLLSKFKSPSKINGSEIGKLLYFLVYELFTNYDALNAHNIDF